LYAALIAREIKQLPTLFINKKDNSNAAKLKELFLNFHFCGLKYLIFLLPTLSGLLHIFVQNAPRNTFKSKLNK